MSAPVVAAIFALVAPFVRAAETPTPAPPGFSFENLIQRAKELSGKPYRAPTNVLPDFLRNLTYDELRDIRFRPDLALWRGQETLFEVQFFHLGFLYRELVRIYAIDEGQVREVQFNPNLFDYGKNRFPEPIPEDLGFAGFRIHYPLHRKDYYDEVAVFLGASYFRVVGANQVYGISARALAIDTALPSGEEFPRFSEFWLEKPRRGATEMTVYALLESQSITGAYHFEIRPGRDTVLGIQSHLFPRKSVQKLGIAPLTTMFMFAENATRYHGDFRPELHDSDGLIVGTPNGEWLWRPLVNPEGSHRVNRFQASDPVGFGVFQRDRDFDSYQDLESHFERRPSFWIEAQGQWGRGAVELVEIPSDEESNDNIVAFWVPEKAAEPGRQLRFDYQLHAILDDLRWPPLARAQATRIHPGYKGKSARFLIDFHGPWLPDLDEDAPVVADVSASRGQIQNLVAQKSAVTGGWRVFFDLDVGQGDAVQLRALLRLGARVLSETWQYQWATP